MPVAKSKEPVMEPTTEPTVPPVETDPTKADPPKAEVAVLVKALHWTISVPDTTLPTRTIQVGSTPCTAETALKKYCDMLGIHKLPREPVITPIETPAP